MVRNRRAFSLLELLLGVTVTTLVGVSAATVAGTLSTRYQKSEDYYQSLQTARVAMGKLQSLFRSAQLVTQVSSSQVMLWQEAAGGDGQLNPSEIVLLTCSGGTVRRAQIVYGSDSQSQQMKLAYDSPVSLGNVAEQPATWAATVDGSLFLSSKTVATGATGFSVTPDTAAPMSKMVTITVTSGQGASAVTLRSTALLRGDRTGCVATVAGHYALVSP